MSLSLYASSLIVIDILFISFMRPGTRHYVLTIKPTMVFGKHFYCSSTLRETCFSLVHTLLADKVITNTSHARITQYIPLFPNWWTDYLERVAKDPTLSDTDPSECRFGYHRYRHYFMLIIDRSVRARPNVITVTCTLRILPPF